MLVRLTQALPYAADGQRVRVLHPGIAYDLPEAVGHALTQVGIAVPEERDRPAAQSMRHREKRHELRN